MLPKNKFVLSLVPFVITLSLVACDGSSNTTQKQSDTKIEKKQVKSEQELKEKSSVNEADQKESASTETLLNNQSGVVSSEGTTESEQTSQNDVSENQPTSNSQAPPATQPKISTSTPSTTTPSVSNPVSAQRVTISIIGPKDHRSILGATKVEIKDGDKVIDVLLKAAGNKVDYSGSGATAYVEGIDNIYEFDYGPQSGWTYKLNGKMIQQSAGAVQVKDGDQIVWTYTEG